MMKPAFVHRVGIQADMEYVMWLTELKARYRQSQAKAAAKVNTVLLEFYWSLGCDIVQRKAESKWGSGFFSQLSLDMRAMFPDEKGFSVTNLKYMKRWYLFYYERIAIRHQPGDELGMPPIFGDVPWKHHVEIFTKSHSLDEALFYIGKTIEQGMSRAALVNCIKANLYEHQGKILNNFAEHMPALQSKLVQEVLKENYDFGFATVKHEIYDEQELEEALSKSVTDLLLELGTGFAFIGRQKELIAGDTTRKIDLLFYHIRLRCYVVCELKAKAFEPEFAGKLNFYVNAVDDILKADDDNPTIGLLICSDMNKADVQWSFRGISTPMGVATYNNVRIKDMLPTQEQLKERMELLQKELRETKRLMKINK